VRIRTDQNQFPGGLRAARLFPARLTRLHVLSSKIVSALRAQADAQVFGLHWRPLYQLKLAARDGVDALADYTATTGSIVFYLPTILLWLLTILVGAAIGRRVLRWAARVFFAFPRAIAAGEAGR
jgi:hypothetical protein